MYETLLNIRKIVKKADVPDLNNKIDNDYDNLDQGWNNPPHGLTFSLRRQSTQST